MNYVQAHYNGFLAEKYPWISGGFDEQIRNNEGFFSSINITPLPNRVAIDLGAGCGFQSVPLARLGYSVIAVDCCQILLDELRKHAGSLPIVTVQSDIITYSSWSGRHPGLIVCMGDTLTHLTAVAAAENLVRQCFSELEPDGRMILSIRDYSREPDGAVVVIPVRRDKERIFLCRIEYHAETLIVQDILYSRERGIWERNAGKYEKIRIASETLTRMLTSAGFAIEYSEADDGMITVIVRKVP